MIAGEGSAKGERLKDGALIQIEMSLGKGHMLIQMFCAFRKCYLKQLHTVHCVVKFKHKYAVTTKKKNKSPRGKADRLAFALSQLRIYNGVLINTRVSTSQMLLIKLLGEKEK